MDKTVDQIIHEFELALASSDLSAFPSEPIESLDSEEKANFYAFDWENGTLDELLDIYDQLNFVAEHHFVQLLPRVLRQLVRHSDDPRVGNVYNVVVYRLAYGTDRWSVINAANRDLSISMIQAVSSVGAISLNDIDVEANEAMRLLISDPN